MAGEKHQSARALHRREARRESFLFIPLLFLAGGLVLAEITAWIDELIHLSTGDAPFFGETIENSRAVVSSVPGATLTFIGVVFSVALVALQLRSNQYSPRVLRGFIRARTSKVTLGIFLATFTFSFLTLASFDTQGPTGAQYVPIISVLVCELLVLASLVVFVIFVHEIIRSMRAAYIIDDIATETDAAIRSSFTADPTSAPTPVTGPVTTTITGWRSGVIAAVDVPALVAAASSAGVTVRVLAPVGAYVAAGETIAEVHGGDLPAVALNRALVITKERTLHQDPAYGLRQIVDIAIRALSPAVNDPTTAVQCVDRLTGLLLLAGRRHEHPGTVADAGGVPRVIMEPPTFERLVTLAFDEIRHYGADSPQIPRRLLDAFATLERDLPPARHAALARQRVLLGEAVEQAWPPNDERADVLVPDRLGLG
jgi:uncharacterized membrane protein